MLIVRRVGVGLVVALAGALVFDVPVAYGLGRGWPLWLAIALGALACPLAPLLWHALRERARARNPPAKSHTRGVERLALRAIAVAIVAIGGLVAIAGGGRVWHAMTRHALWFVPHEPGSLAADSPLFARAPAAATTLVWLRPSEDAVEVFAHDVPALASHPLVGTRDLVYVADDPRTNAWLGARGPRDTLERLDPIVAGVTGVALAKLEDPEDDVRAWATPAWSTPTATNPAPLLALVPRAPDDAVVVVASRATNQRIAPELVAVVGWLRVAGDRLELAAEADFPTEAAAARAAPILDASLARVRAHACAHDRLELVQTRVGHTVRVTGTLPRAQLATLLLCLRER